MSERWQRDCLCPMQLVGIAVEISFHRISRRSSCLGRKLPPHLVVSGTYAMLPVGVSSLPYRSCWPFKSFNDYSFFFFFFLFLVCSGAVWASVLDV